MSSVTDYFEKRADLYCRIYPQDVGARPPLYYRWRWRPLHRYKAIVEGEMGDVRGQSVLDLGCGVGAYAVDLAERGARVTAVDSSEEMVARVRKRAHAAGVLDRVDVVAADGRRWLAATESHFDWALAIGVFDYVDDPDAWLRALGSQCKTLIATFPKVSLRSRLAAIRYRILGVPNRVYRGDDLHRALHMAGFADVRLLSPRGTGFIAIASRARS